MVIFFFKFFGSFGMTVATSLPVLSCGIVENYWNSNQET